MKASFFEANRRRLQKTVGSDVIVLAAYNLVQRSNDAAFTFEQEANFWYLTGIEAPNWWLIIDSGKSWLAAPEIDEVHRIFDGSLSFNDALKISGVDKVITHGEAIDLFNELAKKHSKVFSLGSDPRANHYDFELNPGPEAMRRRLHKIFQKVEDCRLELAHLRAIKQPEEIEAMKSAIKLTVEAFHKLKPQLDTLTQEYEIEAEFTQYFRSYGKHHAYDPIVASAEHACTLHYTDNSSLLKRNELVLLDVGARHEGYAADISRTYAVGTPSKRQKEVHGAVESAHKEIIELLKPGLSIEGYMLKVDEIMKQKLNGLGLLKKPEDYRKYFPHSISHGLGLNEHDALGQPTEFQVGMVLTVEPGIYIPEEGIGVRIEDDILITKTGHENLSAALPTSL